VEVQHLVMVNGHIQILA